MSVFDELNSQVALVANWKQIIKPKPFFLILTCQMEFLHAGVALVSFTVELNRKGVVIRIPKRDTIDDTFIRAL